MSWKTFKKFCQAEQGLADFGSITSFMKKAETVARKIQDPESSKDKEALGRLISELLFITFVLAEQHGVSVDESFLATVDEIILGSVS
jgi:hypothetical protein